MAAIPQRASALLYDPGHRAINTIANCGPDDVYTHASSSSWAVWI